ncbi:MAG: hypothetical protein E6J26_11550 [Chloroflexi bacterium]|nr:MAG: hypothetical protein E6J26_11550 [Chloroflexota bacterium]
MATVDTVALKPSPAALVTPALARPPANLWRDAWRRLVRNKPAVVSMILIGLLVLVAVFAQALAPYSYERPVRAALLWHGQPGSRHAQQAAVRLAHFTGGGAGGYPDRAAHRRPARPVCRLPGQMV